MAVQALMLAASVDCVAAVEVLLEKGATLELQARLLLSVFSCMNKPASLRHPRGCCTLNEAAPTCDCVRC